MSNKRCRRLFEEQNAKIGTYALNGLCPAGSANSGVLLVVGRQQEDRVCAEQRIAGLLGVFDCDILRGGRQEPATMSQRGEMLR